MRLAASTLQCVSVAATEASMSSSRAPSRGWNRWRRKFSDRPSGGRDAFVSGDSHFRSVSEANSAFGRGDGRDYRNSGGFPRPPFRSRPQFRHPRPSRPPQSKPPDFRNWEYAIEQPPSQCERFIVLSYNILADYLAFKHRHELYYHIPRHILDWEWRKRKIVFELGLWSPDIMCFQEVDRFQDLEDELKYRGYSGIWKRRTGIPVDGCATFWRMARFKLLHEECIEFNKFGLRDNVAQICVLESRNQNHTADGSGTFPSSSNEGNRVVVCNIHVLYNPKRGEIKLGQVRVLLEKAYAVSTLWNCAPVVLCGDFNCTPKSPLYNFILEQKLNLTGVARDQISGQSSGQLCAPEPYGWSPGHHTNRNPSPDNPNGASLLNAEKSFDAMHGNPDKTGNMPSTINFTQLQSDSMLQDMSNKLSFDVHSECENTKSGATTEEEVADVNGVEPSSSCYIPDGNPSSSHSEVMIPVDSESGLSNDYTGQSFHRICIYNSSSNIDQSSQVVVTEEKESSHFYLEKENSCREVRVSFSGNEAEFDEVANASISETSPALQSDAFFHEEIKVSPPIENILSESTSTEDNGISSTSGNCAYQVGASDASASVDLNVNKKLVDLSLIDDDDDDDDDDVEVKSRTESIGEDLEKCAALSHESQPTPPSDEVQIEKISSPSVDYEIANVEKNIYDPYLWTPMEIQNASGNAESTIIEHPLRLRSTYAEVEDYSGTRDLSKEPQVTSYNRRFMGTVDYIWCSEGVQTVKVLDTIPKQALQWTPGFPTPKWGSDHLALASQLAFTKNVNQS